MGPGSGSRFATRSTSTCSPGPDGEAYEATIVNHLYARSVFFVKDAERSLRFYTETLGFSLDWKYEEQGRAFVLQVSLLGFELILNQTGRQTEDRAGHRRVYRPCPSEACQEAGERRLAAVLQGWPAGTLRSGRLGRPARRAASALHLRSGPTGRLNRWPRLRPA